MHVAQEVDADLVHVVEDQRDLRGLLAVDGLLPGAVEVDARGVGAQVAAPAAVGVHVGDDEEGGGGAGGAAGGVGVVEEAAEEALGEVLGLGLA